MSELDETPDISAEDVEGHAPYKRGDDDDVEGHAPYKRGDDDDDVEGHAPYKH